MLYLFFVCLDSKRNDENEVRQRKKQNKIEPEEGE